MCVHVCWAAKVAVRGMTTPRFDGAPCGTDHQVLAWGAADSRTQGRHGKRISVSRRYKSRRSGRLTSICARDGTAEGKRQGFASAGGRGGSGDVKGKGAQRGCGLDFFATIRNFLQPVTLLSSPSLNARQECISPHLRPPQPPVQSPCLKSHLRLFLAPCHPSLPPSSPSYQRAAPPARPPAAAAEGPTDTFIVPPPRTLPLLILHPAGRLAGRRRYTCHLRGETAKPPGAFIPLPRPPPLPCH